MNTVDSLTKEVHLISLPETSYSEVWELQRSIFGRLVGGEEEDTLILCEHPPVYTLGRVTEAHNILFTDDELRKIGAEKFEIERGGDVTFHGPGQLVGYPLLNLSRFKEDLGWYLRALEETIIRTLADYDLKGFRIPGRTGVWIGDESKEEKICAIGIKASRWCTMHGFALNVNTDLTYFDRIIPCGIGDRKVTSLSRILKRPIELDTVKKTYEKYFAEVFEAVLN
ncbi:MAG: lipoyl(octanoyl) transferase LipB [Bacteroidota bacterium]|nr:lipoyl(octanoyl) transferase LipB [Bacteroidota bacterium]MDP4235679.1 lipoyl(octanoyl) transferase LipB [Bacteroidota bacterium]